MGVGRVYHREVRARMPKNVQKASDGVIKVCAKVTKRFRNTKEIEARGESLKRGLRKRFGR